ncbi:MAG: DUF4350 domain-containing protein [Gammaproteobacteria bacterium]|nr:MAG: DUF4350 domain-containing protein [Gammaproteobacteria bacterium]
MANRVITFTIVLLCGLLGYVLYSTLEVYEETVDNGWSLKARKNPYLAAEMMLLRLGAATESSNTKVILDHLDDYDSVLIANSGLVVNQRMASKLLQWVEQGGKLVIGANESQGKLLEILEIEYKPVNYSYEKDEQTLHGDLGWDTNSTIKKSIEDYGREKNDDLCKQCDDSKDQNACKSCNENAPSKGTEQKKKLSDALKEANKRNHEVSTEKSDDSSAEEIIPERRLTHLRFNDDEPEINAVFSPWSVISHPDIYQRDNGEDESSTAVNESPVENKLFTPVFWGGSSQGTHLIQFLNGKGMITVVSDASIWDSQQLARKDHGVLLRALGFHQKSLILYGIAMPPITTLAWTHFPEFIISFLLLLILCVWCVATRVGPVQSVNSIDRRSIINSILGAASYQHRRRKYSKLLEPLIADIHTLAKRQLHGFAIADTEKKEKLLSDHTGMSQKNINQLLNPHAVGDDQSFQAAVTLLREIRKTL